MLASHCPEFESIWTHEYENVQIPVLSWKHRAIREAIITHRVTAGCFFQTSAATSWEKAKSLACNKIDRSKSSRRLIFVLTSCVHFALRKAIVMASYQIVTSSLLLRMIIGGIGHFSTHKDKTKETRSCPIVLWRHHDYVRPSQYCRVITVLVKTAKF